MDAKVAPEPGAAVTSGDPAPASPASVQRFRSALGLDSDTGSNSETDQVKKPDAKVLTTQGSYLGAGLAKSNSYFDADDAEEAPAFWSDFLKQVKAPRFAGAVLAVFCVQLLVTFLALGTGQGGNGCAFTFGNSLVYFGVMAMLWREDQHYAFLKPLRRR